MGAGSPRLPRARHARRPSTSASLHEAPRAGSSPRTPQGPLPLTTTQPMLGRPNCWEEDRPRSWGWPDPSTGLKSSSVMLAGVGGRPPQPLRCPASISSAVRRVAGPPLAISGEAFLLTPSQPPCKGHAPLLPLLRLHKLSQVILPLDFNFLFKKKKDVEGHPWWSSG